MTALEPLTGLVVIDEVQRAPDIFPLLGVSEPAVRNYRDLLTDRSCCGSCSPGTPI